MELIKLMSRLVIKKFIITSIFLCLFCFVSQSNAFESSYINLDGNLEGLMYLGNKVRILNPHNEDGRAARYDLMAEAEISSPYIFDSRLIGFFRLDNYFGSSVPEKNKYNYNASPLLMYPVYGGGIRIWRNLQVRISTGQEFRTLTSPELHNL